MKRTSLTTAVIAGIAGVAGISNMASAVYLNNDGLGQVLIYPYYTVNGGNSSSSSGLKREKSTPVQPENSASAASGSA